EGGGNVARVSPWRDRCSHVPRALESRPAPRLSARGDRVDTRGQPCDEPGDSHGGSSSQDLPPVRSAATMMCVLPLDIVPGLPLTPACDPSIRAPALPG